MEIRHEAAMREIARGNIERNLGCVVDPDYPDDIYEEAYTLAFDALKDAGCPLEVARYLADDEARKLAQP